MMQSQEAKRRTAQAANLATKISKRTRRSMFDCLHKDLNKAIRPKRVLVKCPKQCEDRTLPGGKAPRGIREDVVRPLLLRQDTLVGDPRRRPRWGVPIKLDIAHVIATNIDVGIMDLLMAKSHYTGGHEDMAIHIPFVELENDQMTRGEQKRLDGIFLGELTWALINILLVKILLTKPTQLMLNSTLAAAFAMRDVAHYTIARTLELAMNVPRSLQDGRSYGASGTLLHVRLISGRYLGRSS